MQSFQPNQVQLNRENMVKLIELLNDLFEKLGVDQQNRKKMTESVIGLCLKDPKFLPMFLKNITDKKNNELIHFLSFSAELAKSKNHQLQTDITLVLQFLLLSEKDLKNEFKKNPLLLQKMERQLEELKKELLQIAPEKANELDAALKTVEQELDSIEEQLQNNKELELANEAQNKAQLFFESLRGFKRFGGYLTPQLGITNTASLVDENELEIDSSMESPLDWLAKNIFGMGLETKLVGVAGDEMREVQILNDAAQKEAPDASTSYSSPFSVPHGAPRYVPPGGKKE